MAENLATRLQSSTLSSWTAGNVGGYWKLQSDSKVADDYKGAGPEVAGGLPEVLSFNMEEIQDIPWLWTLQQIQSMYVHFCVRFYYTAYVHIKGNMISKLRLFTFRNRHPCPYCV